MTKSKKSKTKSIVVPVGIAFSFIVLWMFRSEGTTAQIAFDPKTLPGIQTGPVPWSAEIEHLRSRLQMIGLPALPTEGTALHIHQHLDIRINGNPAAVPAGIGINEAASFISPVHTHDGSGVIHIESNDVHSFTLGQFFDIWGVRFTKDCVGSYCKNGPNAPRVFSNGNPVMGDPRLLVFEPRQEIAVIYGPPNAIMSVPSSYQFPPGF